MNLGLIPIDHILKIILIINITNLILMLPAIISTLRIIIILNWQIIITYEHHQMIIINRIEFCLTINKPLVWIRITFSCYLNITRQNKKVSFDKNIVKIKMENEKKFNLNPNSELYRFHPRILERIIAKYPN